MDDVSVVRRPRAVLIDHDCLVADGSAEAVARLRRAQVSVAVLCDGAADPRVVALAEPVLCCPHDVDDGCLCRRPAPGLLLQAAALLGVVAEECVVVGSASGDAEAAAAIGAHSAVVSDSSLLAVVDDLLSMQDEPRAVVSDLPASTAPAETGVSDELAAREVIPLVLAGARRLPPVSPWAAGLVR